MAAPAATANELEVRALDLERDGADAQDRVRLVSSNSQAAATCAAGETDACVTTAPAARRFGLEVVRDYGPVPMGFTIHVHAR